MPRSDEPLPIRLRADAALLGVAAVWGLSFVVVKNALETAPPLAFLFARFSLAALLLAPVIRRPARSPRLLRDGLVVGLVLALGMSLQVLGQVTTTASKAAFLTGLSVVLTPFAAYLRSRRLPSLENGVGISLASAGFFLLTFPKTGVFNRGDGLMLGCGIVFAFYVVELGERASRHDPLRLTAIQLAVVGGVAGALALLIRAPGLSALRAAAGEARPFSLSGSLVASVVYLATIGTVGTFVGQTWAQRHVTATHAAILFALEPVFTAILAAWLLSERLGARGTLGGILVLAGIVVSEIRLRRRVTGDG